jgi:hypothetical protein
MFDFYKFWQLVCLLISHNRASILNDLYAIFSQGGRRKEAKSACSEIHISSL